MNLSLFALVLKSPDGECPIKYTYTKNLSSWQESNPWPLEHQAGTLPTKLRELMESNVI